MTLDPLFAGEQLDVWGARVHDDRARVATGWDGLDRYLRGGGFGPSNFVILAGRTGTRKTTVAANLIVNMLDAGHAVGFVGLDEAPFDYVAKLVSVMVDLPLDYLEAQWDAPEGEAIRQEFRQRAHNFVLARGRRPGFGDLDAFLHLAEVNERPAVVFVDYVSLLGRGKYDGKEQQRIPRLMEDLQVWTNEHEVVTVALHQVGRFDEGTGGRYHGEKPMTLEGLKWGGEEIADIVLATYRPALDPLGNVDFPDAEELMPEGWKFEKKQEVWRRAKRRVEKYGRSTFLQLLKNRPGAQPPPEARAGMELVSPSDSMRLTPFSRDVNEGMRMRGGDSPE